MTTARKRGVGACLTAGCKARPYFHGATNGHLEGRRVAPCECGRGVFWERQCGVAFLQLREPRGLEGWRPRSWCHLYFHTRGFVPTPAPSLTLNTIDPTPLKTRPRGCRLQQRSNRHAAEPGGHWDPGSSVDQSLFSGPGGSEQHVRSPGGLERPFPCVLAHLPRKLKIRRSLSSTTYF